MLSQPAWAGRLHRAVLLLTVGLPGLVMLPGFVEPVMLPKATVVVAGAVVLVALAAVRTLLSGQVRIPRSLALATLIPLLVWMTVVTVAAADPGTSAIGRYTRYGGAVEYAAYAVVLATIAVLFRGRLPQALTRVLLAALTLVLLYAGLQVVGLDPLAWRTRGRNEAVFSTLGNTNFASAYTGILVPIALSEALRARRSIGWRVVCALLALAGLAYTLRLGVIQGPVVALLGCFVVVVASGGVTRGFLRARPLPVRAAAGGAAVVALVGGFAFLRFVVADLPNSLHQRTQLWTAAVTMARDRPLLGTGLDGYGDYFLANRPVEHAAERGVAFIDAAHQVPLSMFTHGGVPLGLFYLVFIATIGVVLVRGLRSSSGDHRVVLAGYGGAWVAYQVQSLVSVDVPPVALLHYVSAGAIVALAAPPRLATWTLPGRVPALRAVAAGVVLLLLLPVLGQVLRPVRADANATLALRAGADGDRQEAIARTRRALELLPIEPSYRRALGKRLAAVDPEEGFAQLQQAARDEPGSVALAQDVVLRARALGDVDTQERWEAELLRRDPSNARLLVRQARRDFLSGDPDEAARLLERALDVDPSYRSAAYNLALVHTSQGDREAARRTYERLLEVHPQDPVASAWLEQDRGQQ